MTKLLLLVIAAAVIYFVVTGFARKRARSESDAAPRSESMVPCAHCGINVPRSEALEDARGFYCSEEHRRLSSG